jgi:hypothetical protein
VLRFLLKRLGSLAASPFPNNPRLDTRRPPDEFTALGRGTPGADIAPASDRRGIEEALPCHTPSSHKHGKRIVGRKLDQAVYPIVIFAVKCIAGPFKLNAAGFGSELDGQRIS